LVASSSRRDWLIQAREAHRLTREEAALLVEKRYRPSARRKPMTPAQAVEARRLKPGLSQPDLSILIANIVGSCSQNEICKIETGERQRIKPEIVVALSRILHMTRDEVQYGRTQPRIDKILGEVQGDEAIRLYAEPEGLDGQHVPLDMEGYRVAVDTLWPRFIFGTILFCRTANTPIEECVGRDCVAEIDGQLYVGEVEAGATPRLMTLKRYRNPTLIDRQPARISPIEWTRHFT
jgi:hypothetical protein